MPVKHGRRYSYNKSAMDGTVGNAAFRTGAISLGQTSKKHMDASRPRRYGDLDKSMDADYRRRP